MSVFLLCGANKCFSTLWCSQVLGIYFSYFSMRLFLAFHFLALFLAWLV